MMLKYIFEKFQELLFIDILRVYKVKYLFFSELRVSIKSFFTHD